jgi:hypothetical protein
MHISYFAVTLQWRQEQAVDRILDQPDQNEALFQKHVRHHLMGRRTSMNLFLWCRFSFLFFVYQ